MIIKDENKLRLRTTSKILVLGFIFILIGFFSPSLDVNAVEQYGTCNWVEAEQKRKEENYLQANCLAKGNTATWVGYYYPLAPLPGLGNREDGGIDTAQIDSTGKSIALGAYLNTMIKIIIGIAAILSVVMIVIGGIEYMTSELISSKEAGKETIKNALFGLLVALGAYALLNTINPDLLKSDLDVPGVTVTVDLEADVPQTYDPATRKYANGALFNAPWNDTVGGITPACTTETGTGCLPRSVTAKQPECSTIGQQNCTSTRGLNTSNLRTIQYGCGCNVLITGGTEWWLHGGRSGSTTHQSGSTTVDLRTTPELTRYLMGGTTAPVAGRRYPTPVGSALFEGNHWHIGP
ncbi:hypothetical protein A3A95_00265 [Candidatus Nomurabacteria bacterium RIFCSPLOWO2_01_FULL_39_18]|uniref:Uncharacterized protein n=1 Tax=Candidatus Nomurabacteria bacterium RIFCSPHIGHO2_01_FULL_40_24b TaxID=1801739 RepID=A0A1F6V933_9BACT|nr:MAG: hypothetical protein A2647_03115 [Candidatus Nomurabacteria bacterium RIFCSPHIGHO2_01_FULL_40_24b]OGI90510.1 MAG: hypothetical protein A3A95_00265 [Candidatus Nomurabacteria bacterium RIFCSPLOWO2_01_FULL_39_18]